MRRKITIEVNTELLAKVDQLAREEAVLCKDKFSRVDFFDRALRRAVDGLIFIPQDGSPPTIIYPGCEPIGGKCRYFCRVISHAPTSHGGNV